MDEIINAAIDEYYLARRKPRVSDLLIEVVAVRSAIRRLAGRRCGCASPSNRRLK